MLYFVLFCYIREDGPYFCFEQIRSLIIWYENIKEDSYSQYRNNCLLAIDKRIIEAQYIPSLIIYEFSGLFHINSHKWNILTLR